MEDFVPYELAVKLKEKGFYLSPSDVIAKFDSDGVYHSQLYINFTETMDSEEIIAPTISQVLKWLREEKKIYIGVSYVGKIKDSKSDFYYHTIQTIGDFESMQFGEHNEFFDSYESAVLVSIEYVIDNLI